MPFLDYQTKDGKAYTILPIHIRALESVGKDSTRIYATIGGIPMTFVANRPHADVKAEWQKALAEESEQST